MTTLEALDAVELALTNLGLTAHGEPIIGIEAAGIVAKFAGEPWSEAEDLFQAGKIEPEEYFRRLKYWIDEFGRKHHVKRLCRKLDDIHLDQVELDLLEGA